MVHARLLCVAIPVLVAACHAQTKEPAAAGTVTAATIAKGPAAAQSERMPRCPNVVTGATTVVSEVPGGVELLVTAEGDAAKEIRKRAAVLPTDAAETRGKHQASGAGNAQFGRCPVVMRNTKLEVRDIPGGAAVVVRPSNPTQLAWLRREVEARAAQVASPRPFGPGRMKTCPSAVPSSATLVLDTPYGVDVKVTAASAEVVEAIRARTKELTAQGAVPNNRCPESVPDATLTVSDVPGGVAIAIRPNRPDEVTTLRHDVHERARSYEPPTVHTRGASSNANANANAK